MADVLKPPAVTITITPSVNELPPIPQRDALSMVLVKFKKSHVGRRDVDKYTILGTLHRKTSSGKFGTTHFVNIGQPPVLFICPTASLLKDNKQFPKDQCFKCGITGNKNEDNINSYLATKMNLDGATLRIPGSRSPQFILISKEYGQNIGSDSRLGSSDVVLIIEEAYKPVRILKM
eukprot:505435_1